MEILGQGTRLMGVLQQSVGNATGAPLENSRWIITSASFGGFAGSAPVFISNINRRRGGALILQDQGRKPWVHIPASPRLRPASLRHVNVLMCSGLRFVGPASPRLRPASLGRAMGRLQLACWSGPARLNHVNVLMCSGLRFCWSGIAIIAVKVFGACSCQNMFEVL